MQRVSVAFSANDKGVVPLQFDPLTRAGGERRWNVAVTRARRQVVLYCSFDPAELRADETQSVGVKHLKAYLQIAQAGFGAADGSLDRASLPDAHRDELAQALIEAGLSARADIGLSEFRVDVALSTVEEPDRPLVAVLLDGPSWRRRRTVSDRDGLPESVLKNAMGWPAVKRVWLPEWLADRDAVIARLRAAVDRADAEMRERRELEAARVAAAVSEPVAPPVEFVPGEEAAEREDDVLLVRHAPSLSLPPTVERFAAQDAERSADRNVAHVRSSLADGAASRVVERTAEEIGYTTWPARTVGTLELLNALPSPEPTRLISDLVVQIVEAEGPIHEMRAAKLVAGAFGLLKVHGARSDSILRCFPEGLRRASDPGFLWAEG